MTSPKVLVIAGPNGSGKSTLTQQLSGMEIEMPPYYINADDIARQLLLDGSDAMQEGERERVAFHRARALRREYREQRVSFAFETVCSHPSNLLDLGKLRAAGYEVTLAVVTTANPEINVKRVAQRVKIGGHGVEEVKIRQRYGRFMRLMPRLVEMADEAFVFDATDNEARLCYKTGRIPVQIEVPAYLRDRLLTPLAQRQSLRAHMEAQIAPEETLHHLDEEAGIYEGDIRTISSYYCLQKIDIQRLILHDFALLDGIVEQGSNVRIAYAQGCGSVTLKQEQEEEKRA